MEMSYDEIVRLLDRLDLSPDNLAFRGSNGFLADDAYRYTSAAVDDLIERAIFMSCSTWSPSER